MERENDRARYRLRRRDTYRKRGRKTGRKSLYEAMPRNVLPPNLFDNRFIFWLPSLLSHPPPLSLTLSLSLLLLHLPSLSLYFESQTIPWGSSFSLSNGSLSLLSNLPFSPSFSFFSSPPLATTLPFLLTPHPTLAVDLLFITLFQSQSSRKDIVKERKMFLF